MPRSLRPRHPGDPCRRLAGRGGHGPGPRLGVSWKLDAGEEAVLTLALGSPDCEVVIDDLAGRRCAAAHGIPLIGTLGMVILAKRIGRIAAARPVIEELRRAGLRVSEEVIANALKPEGE